MSYVVCHRSNESTIDILLMITNISLADTPSGVTIVGDLHTEESKVVSFPQTYETRVVSFDEDQAGASCVARGVWGECVGARVGMGMGMGMDVGESEKA